MSSGLVACGHHEKKTLYSNIFVTIHNVLHFKLLYRILAMQLYPYVGFIFIADKSQNSYKKLVINILIFCLMCSPNNHYLLQLCVFNVLKMEYEYCFQYMFKDQMKERKIGLYVRV